LGNCTNFVFELAAVLRLQRL